MAEIDTKDKKVHQEEQTQHNEHPVGVQGQQLRQEESAVQSQSVRHQQPEPVNQQQNEKVQQSPAKQQPVVHQQPQGEQLPILRQVLAPKQQPISQQPDKKQQFTAIQAKTHQQTAFHQQPLDRQQPIETQQPMPKQLPSQEKLQPLPQAVQKATRFAEILAMLRLPLTKTPTCKHKYSCIQSILRDSSKITLVSYLIKSGLSTIFGIKKIFKKPSHLLQILTSKDSINFGLFVGSFVFIFRTVLCTLRRMVSEQRQKYIPLFAGFLGGIVSVLFLQKKTRQSFGLFLMARAIDITYQSLVKKGYLPEFKYFYVLLYCLMMGISGYAYGTEPGSMSPEMNKFYLTFTNQTLSDMQMRQIWIERKNNYLAKFGIPRQDPLDYMPKLKKYYQSLKAAKS